MDGSQVWCSAEDKWWWAEFYESDFAASEAGFYMYRCFASIGQQLWEVYLESTTPFLVCLASQSREVENQNIFDKIPPNFRVFIRH